MGNENIFSKLQIEGWRQFDNIEIDLHERLTIITGANGSGKSTLLSLFNQHFGWSRAYLAVPSKGRSGSTDYRDSIFRSRWKRFFRSKQDQKDIGSIYYTSGGICNLVVSANNLAQYGIGFLAQHAVDGLFIDSYRPPPVYQPVPSISMQAFTSDQAYTNYNSEMYARYQGGYTGSSPILRMKEALISMAIFGEGNSELGSNIVAKAAYDGFNEVLRKILPDSLGFERIAIRNPEVVLVTKSGDFMIDASSGGIMTLLDISWRIYLYSIGHSRFSVIMDEPENHLHPSMQRSLMRRLLDAFPNAQFIVASHSPFIVTSVKDSNVYVLRYRNQQTEEEGPSTINRVYSHKLERINKAASADDILREVLGVPATMPEWVEDDLQAIIRRFASMQISRETLSALRSELEQVGFSEYYPEAIAAITANK